MREGMRRRQPTQKKPLAFDERDVRGKAILLHACCAPDATAALEYWKPLASRIVVFFFNPNIHPEQEYALRLEAMKQVARHYGVELVAACTEEELAECDDVLSAFADEKEGGQRCEECYSLRLRRTARMAQEMDMDAFATTLTISPHKNHNLINALGMKAAAECGVDYIPTNFKKGEGFKRSVDISRELRIYRQHYCGCRWSART
jgi:predicted adenine nucleotide alpha hydrolase (AANH) superfamily ATPase